MPRKYGIGWKALPLRGEWPAFRDQIQITINLWQFPVRNRRAQKSFAITCISKSSLRDDLGLVSINEYEYVVFVLCDIQYAAHRVKLLVTLAGADTPSELNLIPRECSPSLSPPCQGMPIMGRFPLQKTCLTTGPPTSGAETIINIKGALNFDSNNQQTRKPIRKDVTIQMTILNRQLSFRWQKNLLNCQ